jgi:AcrR family transcriptional regulator
MPYKNSTVTPPVPNQQTPDSIFPTEREQDRRSSHKLPVDFDNVVIIIISLFLNHGSEVSVGLTRKRLSRVERKADTRERLLSSALVVFAREGFEGASLEEIAEEAGFSTGAIYSAFGGKQELFFALLDRCLEQEKRDLGEIFERDEPLEVRISAVGRWKPGPLESAEQWRVLATEFWLHAVRDPRARALLAERHRRQRAAAALLLEGAYREQGRQPPVEAGLLADAVIGMQIGMAMRAIVDPEAVPEGSYARVLGILLGTSDALGKTPPGKGKEEKA